MKEYNKNIGNYGENVIEMFLKNKNHKILHRNFMIRNGEIDIISKYKDIIIFTEVKTRYSNKYGAPLQSITISKQNNIKRVANYYIYINKLQNFYIRFDVAEVILNHIDNSYKINIIENAFN